MKILILWLAVCAAVYCTPGKVPSKPACKVSQWGSWGKCESKKQCFSQPRPPTYSYGVQPAVHGHGDGRREFSMKRKLELYAIKQKCLSDPKCSPVFLRDNEGFVACENGFVNELPCDGVDQMSFINFETLSGNDPAATEVNDIWGWVDPENGDEYAVVCTYGGTSFVRITDPSNPVVVGYLPTRTSPNNWRDAKVIGNYVYIVSEASDHGLQIYDLTQLRDSDGFQEVEATATYSEFGNCHNIVANPETNFVYAVGATHGNYPNLCSGGLHVVDVSDPLNPTFAGCFGDDGYVHDAQCTIYTGPDTEHQGKEICFCSNEDSLTIVDVTDKDNMNIISKESYIGYAYTHQGWMTEDQSVLLLDDELDEIFSPPDDKYTKTFIWNIADLETPILMNTYLSSEKSVDHNQYVLGNLTYQSNYYAGLRILQIDQDNFDLNEVAFFDVIDTEVVNTGGGSWSNYPYFPSGNIALGSIDYGFFVVRPNMEYIQEKIRTKQFGFQTRSRHILHTNQDVECPSLVEKRTCVPQC